MSNKLEPLTVIDLGKAILDSLGRSGFLQSSAHQDEPIHIISAQFRGVRLSLSLEGSSSGDPARDSSSNKEAAASAILVGGNRNEAAAAAAIDRDGPPEAAAAPSARASSSSNSSRFQEMKQLQGEEEKKLSKKISGLWTPYMQDRTFAFGATPQRRGLPLPAPAAAAVTRRKPQLRHGCGRTDVRCRTCSSHSEERKHLDAKQDRRSSSHVSASAAFSRHPDAKSAALAINSASSSASPRQRPQLAADTHDSKRQLQLRGDSNNIITTYFRPAPSSIINQQQQTDDSKARCSQQATAYSENQKLCIRRGNMRWYALVRRRKSRLAHEKGMRAFLGERRWADFVEYANRNTSETRQHCSGHEPASYAASTANHNSCREDQSDHYFLYSIQGDVDGGS